MRRRRQQKLEKKLQQFRSRDGGPDTGGTLKIYGESLCRDVPYKTLLLSIRDCAQAVVREMLAKYGMDKADPLNYCLVQVEKYFAIISLSFTNVNFMASCRSTATPPNTFLMMMSVLCQFSWIIPRHEVSHCGIMRVNWRREFSQIGKFMKCFGNRWRSFMTVQGLQTCGDFFWMTKMFGNQRRLKFVGELFGNLWKSILELSNGF